MANHGLDTDQVIVLSRPQPHHLVWSLLLPPPLLLLKFTVKGGRHSSVDSYSVYAFACLLPPLLLNSQQGSRQEIWQFYTGNGSCTTFLLLASVGQLLPSVQTFCISCPLPCCDQQQRHGSGQAYTKRSPPCCVSDPPPWALTAVAGEEFRLLSALRDAKGRTVKGEEL